MSPPSNDRRWVFTIAALCLLSFVIWVCLPWLTSSARAELPDSVEPYRIRLQQAHKPSGEGCARWKEDQPVSPEVQSEALNELAAIIAIDLRTLLPITARIRTENHKHEGLAHGADMSAEFMNLVLADAPAAQKLWLSAEGTDMDVEWPLLAALSAQTPTQAEHTRWLRLMRYLNDEERSAVDGWIKKWRLVFATKSAQAALVHHVAEKITQARIAELTAIAKRYKTHYGVFPMAFESLLRFAQNINLASPTLLRGITPDGALRDGWLRPFSYYTKSGAFVLTSEGPSSKSKTDDIVVSEE